MLSSAAGNTAYFFVVIQLLSSQICHGNGETFRIMSFNIWECGKYVNDGIQKIAKHINVVQPDVVALQEVNYNTNSCYSNISSLLGPKWYKDIRKGGYPNNAIFSRWPIINGSHVQTGYGTAVDIEYKSVNGPINMTIWGVHFTAVSEGPEAACNKHVTQEYQIMAGETGRIKNAQEIATLPAFQKALKNADKKPLILVGDFNTPSHLDWIESTKSSHCDWSFKWPATVIFDDLGMKDSYREMHQDPKADPAITYSDVYKYLPAWDYTIPYPPDRIDFILYKSSLLKVIKSMIYNGDKPVRPMPHQKHNDWPSDHNSVITDFQLVNPAEMKTPSKFTNRFLALFDSILSSVK